ncbi:thiol-disulfide oxidoreductase [Chlorella sorokiniana]|uniref:Thiol-disulfide oxidoreductase n=1 Tax=Chlorella sorokiniana TaxID=3076 RepID=A0A2P6TX59_CHLSO|nr:thiol-disulfide oxidoreductase [Chlorella sorokiniana]|eukprot:PRW58655.1 thiol-disulfide oxidoreductase [Chlorella sorokiniana]
MTAQLASSAVGAASRQALRAARGVPQVAFSQPQARRLVARAGSDAAQASSSQPSWHIKMLYDGECPLCMREVEMLMRRDQGKGNIAFVDVASPEYDPAQNGGISFEKAMERIHAIEADGRVITDVEVFRRLYEEVGLGWVYAITKNPTVESLANKVYDVWARYRLPITGRPDLAVVMQQKKMCRADSGSSSEAAAQPAQQQRRAAVACCFFLALLAARVASEAAADDRLPLPDTASEPNREIKLGEKLALHELGPLIVAADGSLRRIDNWAILSEAERATALRRLGQRNRQRTISQQMLPAVLAVAAGGDGAAGAAAAADVSKGQEVLAIKQSDFVLLVLLIVALFYAGAAIIYKLALGRSLRVAWERQQRAAELAAAVARIPQLARSKPAFFAAQLQPVLLALRQAAEAEKEAEGEAGAAAQEQQASSEQALSAEQQEGQQSEQARSAAQRQLAAAAAHLRRLIGIDRQGGANASLLLWLLLGLATQGQGVQAALLASLCASLGWQALLLEALPLLLLSAQPEQQAPLADLASIAAAEAANSTDSQLQEAALQVAACLASQQAWLRQLREALAADAELQRSCRRELVAVANRLASEPGTGAAGTPAVVHGEERRRRTAAAVAALLPHTLLCPAAVLERLVKEAVVQAGEQVGLLLDVLQEMAPLAGYRSQPTQPPLLLTLLARLLLPSQLGPASAAALDTPGSRDAFVQLVAGLCGCRPAAHGKPSAPAAAAAAVAAAAASGQQPLLSPAAVLEHVVSPALRLQQQADGAADPGQLLLPLQLAQLLIGSPAAVTVGAQQQQQQQQQHAAHNLALLQLQLEALLDLDGRRIDHSAAALQASPETFDLAAAILQQAGASGSAAGDSAATAAGRYFRRQLQHAGRPEPGQQPQPVAQQRQHMVLLLAALLPCLTAAEAAEVLQAALPATIQELLLPPAARQQAGATILPGAHAAAVEAACRAVLALALQPGLAAIAGQQGPAAEADLAPTAEARPPSALREVAVERALQHVVQHCVNLAAAGAAPAAGSPAAPQPALQLQAAEAQALALRCTRELCQLAAAFQRAGYDCSTAQVRARRGTGTERPGRAGGQ